MLPLNSVLPTIVLSPSLLIAPRVSSSIQTMLNIRSAAGLVRTDPSEYFSLLVDEIWLGM